MREIKFRAWHVKNKCFAPTMYWFLDPIGVARWQEDHKEAAVIVEQYTGISDKNGKEIYEGDIVFTSEDHPYDKVPVIFKDGCFCSQDANRETWTFNMRYIDEVEVIGNIHENPELLEK